MLYYYYYYYFELRGSSWGQPVATCIARYYDASASLEGHIKIPLGGTLTECCLLT